MNPEEVAAFLSQPAAPLPPGKIRNLENPSNLKTECLTVAILFYLLASIIISCHAYTVIRLLRKVSFEDLLLYVAWLSFSAFVGVALWACLVPIGIHQWNMRIATQQIALYRVNLALIMFGVTIALLKVALALKMLKVFVPQGSRNFMFWISWAVIGVHTIFYFIYVMLLIFACSPRRAIWDLTIAHGHCIKQSWLTITSCFMNVITDFVLLALPHFVIWKLNMPLGRKQGLSILFCLGFFILAASICRLYYIMIYRTSSDKSYFLSIQGIVALVELAAGFMVACLPVIPKFFATVLSVRLFPSGPSRVSREARFLCTGKQGLRMTRGSRWGWPRGGGGESDKELVERPVPNAILVTQTYQVLFEDADPERL